MEFRLLAAAYLGMLAPCLIGIICAAYRPQWWVRAIWALLLGVAGYGVIVFAEATRSFLTYDAFVTMLQSHGSAQDALQQNRVAFIAAIWPSLLIAAAMLLPVRRKLPTAFFLREWMQAALFLRGGEGGRGLPPGYVGTSYSLLCLFEESTRDRSARQEPAFAPSHAPVARNIVLVIDESIAPKYLAINHPAGVATPLDDQREGIGIHNFGIAVSITGCSTSTNGALRYGGTCDDHLRMIGSYPSIWASARDAGLRTVYIDGQQIGATMQNLMQPGEKDEIDQVIDLAHVSVRDRDMAVAEALVEQLRAPGPKFILVSKVGAHFPVHDKFPDQFARARPMLPRGCFADIADTGRHDGFSGDPGDWRRYRTSYRNTLSWNVGKFFERVLTHTDLSDTVLLYTADHRQNLYEDGSPGTNTHCSPEPDMAEGAVPLVAIEGDGASGIEWTRRARANHDRSSHYMIFPTLLRLMGYDAGEVMPIYGASLLQPSRDPMTFNTRFNARLGSKPEWMTLDPGDLAIPPQEDLQ